MTKNIKFAITRFVFSSSNCTKICFRPGLRPDPAVGAYDAPPDPLVGWGGGYQLPLPIVLPTRRLEFGAYGASVLRPPSTQNLGYTPVLSSQPESITALWLVQNYTAW